MPEINEKNKDLATQHNTQNYSVSVVIPAYNAEKHIQRSIDSVLRQTRPADEIIVVDDGSTDNTPVILSEYGNKIIPIRQQNAGASIARTTGIERASGDWIAFLDADDEWLPSMLEAQIKNLIDNPELAWSYSNYWFARHDTDRVKIAFPTPPTSNNIITDYLSVHTKYCIRTSAAIIKKSALYDSGLFVPDQKWVQDTDLFLRIAYQYPQIGYLHEPLAKYYCDLPESLTARYCCHANELCLLVERHLVLSRECNRQKELIKSMSEKIPYWVNVTLQYKNYHEARIMLKRIGHIIPNRIKWKLKLKAYFPFLERFWDAMLHFVKRHVIPERLKIRKPK
ncbi:MAG: glycosyltransferase [Phycisphaerae bacterium]|nr:glycosyltransferase [Phycisphaerae bacterium]